MYPKPTLTNNLFVVVFGFGEFDSFFIDSVFDWFRLQEDFNLGSLSIFLDRLGLGEDIVVADEDGEGSDALEENGEYGADDDEWEEEKWEDDELLSSSVNDGDLGVAVLVLKIFEFVKNFDLDNFFFLFRLKLDRFVALVWFVLLIVIVEEIVVVVDNDDEDVFVVVAKMDFDEEGGDDGEDKFSLLAWEHNMTQWNSRFL